MADFVNYSKRDIKLPPGCKDLIDVLKPGAPSKYAQLAGKHPVPGEPKVSKMTEWFKQHTRRSETSGVIADIPRHIHGIWASTAPKWELRIRAPEIEGTLRKWYCGEKLLDVQVEENSSHDRAIRIFLTDRGIEVPEPSPTPACFIPGLPVYVYYDVEPIPSDPVALASLVMDAFKFAGVVDGSAVEFDIDELLKLPPGLQPNKDG
jgi:hypothetical protein